MARINIDDDLRADPRFHQLCDAIGRAQAYGSLICLWDLGMAFWRKEKGLIPTATAEQTPNYAELIRAGFAVKRPGGVYCSGAEEKWDYLLARSAAGRRSSQVRTEKYGTPVPVGATNFCSAGVRGSSEQNPNKTEPSSSSSRSKELKEPSASNTKKKLEPVLVGTYIKLYQERFSRRPVFTGKEQGILLRVQKQLGVEKTKELLEKYLKSSNEWFEKNAFDLATFENKLNLIASEPAAPVRLVL